MRWWQRLIVNTIAFLALAGFISGFHVQSFGTAVLAAVVLAFLNIIIKPILVILSLPFTVLTLGLFYFVINGIMLSLVASLVGGFSFSSFWVALLVAFILSIINMIFDSGVS